MNIALHRPRRKTILFATYVSPYPPHSGERIRCLNLIAALRQLGYRVEAFAGNFDGIDLRGKTEEGLCWREIPFAWPRLRQAAHIYWRSDAEFIRQVEALHYGKGLSAILLDYGFMGAQIAPLLKLGIPVILGTHNLESALTGQCPRSNAAKGFALSLRQAVEWTHERRYFPRADVLLCVSDEDRAAYARFIPEEKLHIVPNFIDVPDIYARAERKPRIVMTGSFDNFQNRDGLHWFLSEVWDASLRARTSLCIAGKHSDTALNGLPPAIGVTALGARDDLLSEIASSRLAIVPIRQGGGTRFKCLEAMATRTPVVTTSKGCEGIAHGGAFRVADTPEQFRRAIAELLSNPEACVSAGTRGRAAYDAEYGLAANALKLERALIAAERQSARRIGKGERVTSPASRPRTQ